MGSGRAVDGGVPAVAPAIVHEVLAAPGIALPAALAGRAGLGFDPSTVRIHCDARAAASARAVGAEAYTVGRHIVFADGAYAPDSAAGGELLRHELQHAAEQGEAAIPAIGGLEIAGEALEGAAARAERGGFTRPGRALGPVLQRRREQAARVTGPRVEAFRARVRVAIDQGDSNAVARTIAELGPEGGPALVRLDPAVRGAVARLPFLSPSQRVDSLARLAGADPEAAHVRAARGFVFSRARGATAVAAVGGSAAARQVEGAFDRDLFDVLPGRPTLVRCLRGAGERGVQFTRSDGLIQASDVPILRAWMLLDHDPQDVEANGLSLAADQYAPMLQRVREVSAHGRSPDALEAYAKAWDTYVRQLRGWRRAELFLSHAWCLVDLEEALRERLPEGPRLQVRALFDEVRSQAAARAELADFDAQVAKFGRGAALERLADSLLRTLQVARYRDFVGGGEASGRAIRSVFARLRFWRAVDVRGLARAYQEASGRALVDDIRRAPGIEDDKLGLLGLLTTGSAYADFVRLAQAIFRREPAEAHRVLYGVPDAARPQLLEDYAAAFAGLGEDDRVATAYRHVRAEFARKRAWELEKTQVLLDALPTTAEELYFHTLALAFANQASARKILEAARTGGAAGVRQLHDAWEARVRGGERAWLGLRSLTTRSLREAMREALSGDHRDFAEALFTDYAGALSGPAATGVSIRDLEPGLRGLDRAVFSGQAAAIKREAERVAGIVKAVRAQDRDGAHAAALEAAEGRVRAYIGAQARVGRVDDATRKQALSQYVSGGKLGDADEIYRQWHLRPTIGSNEDAANAILAIVTRRWLDGSLRALSREADTPTRDPRTGEVLRPAYALALLSVTRGLFNGREHAIYSRFHFMYVSDHGRAETAAIRLWLELQAPGFSPTERLGGALGFLGLLQPAELPAVLGRFVATHAPGRAASPVEAFIDYLIDDFGLAKEVPQLADLARGAADDVGDLVRRGRLAEASRHTGFFSGVAAWLAAGLGGRDLRPAITQSLANLEAIARDERIQPEQLARNVRRSGLASAKQLAERQYEDLKAYIADEHQLKAEAAQMVQFMIEVVLRAGLVALFGPAGLAGFVIGVGTVAGGRVAAEGLLGANYELLSEKNVADLVTEVTGPLFEAVKLEDRIGALVNAVTQGPFGRRVFTAALTKVSTATIDGAIERAIQQNGAADVDRMIGAAVGAFVEGLGKVVADRVTINTTSFSSFNERWMTQVTKQLLVGPPPKASALASGIKELVKFAQDYQLKGKDELDIEDIKRRFYTWVVTTLLTGGIVGTSFTVDKHREARRRVRTLEAHPEAFAALADHNPRIREILAAVPRDQQGRALLDLARDREFGRARIPGRFDPHDASTVAAGRTLRAELEGVAKLVPADGVVTAKEVSKARNDEALLAARQARKETAARELARTLGRAPDVDLVDALRRRREEPRRAER